MAIEDPNKTSLKSKIFTARDLPGDALVLKRKYNLEKGQLCWNNFQWALKLWEITVSCTFRFSGNIRKTPCLFFIAASIWSYAP